MTLVFQRYRMPNLKISWAHKRTGNLRAGLRNKFSLSKPYARRLQKSVIEAMLSTCVRNANENAINNRFKVRPYDPSSDRHFVQTLSPSLWDGRDWVPKLIDYCQSDNRNYPFVLVRDDENVPLSFVNIRRLSNHFESDGVDVNFQVSRFYVEGVRVSQKRQGEGIGTITVRDAVECVRVEERKRNVKKTLFLSVTEPENIAMCTIFARTGWKPISGYMHMWPSVRQVSRVRDQIAIKKAKKSFFEWHNIPPPTHDAIVGVTQSWRSIKTSGELLSAMESLRERGASGLRPEYFSAEVFKDAVAFLDGAVAEKEGRVVWGLDRNSNGIVVLVSLVFARPVIVEKLPNIPRNVISVCAIDQLAAEESVRFLAFDVGLDNFQIGFDTPITMDMFQASPILSSTKTDTFTFYENDNS